MSRCIICYEGITKLVGQTIAVGALKFDQDKKYPLTIDFDHSSDNIVGYGMDIRREDDGSITAKIILRSPYDVLHEDLFKTHGVSIFADKVERTELPEDVIINSADLIALSLTEHVPWAPAWRGEDYYEKLGKTSDVVENVLALDSPLKKILKKNG